MLFQQFSRKGAALVSVRSPTYPEVMANGMGFGYPVTGTCDKVGVTGAMLGGGLGPIQGVHGMMIDNLLSARMITAEGKLVTASEIENPDLFWALRGAGQRFGLVTSVTFKTHDLATLGSKDGSIWNGLLVWGEHQLEQLTEVINSFNWNKHTTAYFAFLSMPPNPKVYHTAEIPFSAC